MNSLTRTTLMIAFGFAAAPGCFFSLADPVEKKVDSGASGTGGSGATDGSSGTGGASGTDGSMGGADASTGGRDASVADGAVDHDAGAVPESGAQDSCEFPIIQDAAPEDVISASGVTGITIDGKGDDWPSDFEWHSIAQGCQQCACECPIPLASDWFPPPPDDLSARFRVGWDDTFFYVFVEVHDDDIETAQELDAGTSQLGPATGEDAVELMIDGSGPPPDGGGSGYGPTVFQIYFGVDRNLEYPFQPPLTRNGDHDFAVAIGTNCYAIEIRLSWSYLGRKQNNTIGFTAAVNDWDTVPTAARDSGLDATIQTEVQSHVFSNDPGNQYWNGTNGFGAVVLQ